MKEEKDNVSKCEDSYRKYSVMGKDSSKTQAPRKKPINPKDNKQLKDKE